MSRGEFAITGRQDKTPCVEIVGPAGVGKSSLFQALIQSGVCTTADLQLRRVAYAPFLMRNSLLLAPIVLSVGRTGRWLGKELTQRMLFAMTLCDVTQRYCSRSSQPVVLDQGPVYMLAKIYGAGGRLIRDSRYTRWWAQMLTRCAAMLDVIVWLDAPDAVLIERICTRHRQHRMKTKPAEEIVQFLTGERQAIHVVVLQLTNAGGPGILRCDSQQESVRQLRDQVLARLGVDSPLDESQRAM